MREFNMTDVGLTAIGFLGPCGMNSPHTHPRATEINFSINTTLRGGVLVENGARFAEIDIRPGTATIFPQGAIHFEMNPSCEEAMFVAGQSLCLLHVSLVLT